MKVGVLALQGAFKEHIRILNQIGVDTQEVRTKEQLVSVDRLIIPGGESTAIAKLANDFNLIQPLKDFCKVNPVWGTCAGLIFLAKDVGTTQTTLDLLDVKVKRNAFGNQLDSFIKDLTFPFLSNPNQPFSATFIRAPLIESVTPNVEVLAKFAEGQIIAVKQGSILATSFHPELSDDFRFHQYFLNIC